MVRVFGERWRTRKGQDWVISPAWGQGASLLRGIKNRSYYAGLLLAPAAENIGLVQEFFLALFNEIYL